MDQNEKDFFEEIAENNAALAKIIEKYGFQDHAMVLNAVGIIDDIDPETNMLKLNMSFVFQVDSKEELEEMFSSARAAYEEHNKFNDDLDDLLNGFNISLN